MRSVLLYQTPSPEILQDSIASYIHPRSPGTGWVVKTLNDICGRNEQVKRNNESKQNSAEDSGLNYSEKQ